MDEGLEDLKASSCNVVFEGWAIREDFKRYSHQRNGDVNPGVSLDRETAAPPSSPIGFNYSIRTPYPFFSLTALSAFFYTLPIPKEILIKENRLLSPYRGRQGAPLAHEGTITTEAPNLMWGTDATKVITLDDGWVWVFSAVEHWNAECVGWHVTKLGNRFAALEPISQGLTSLYGSVTADVARGLLLRMDHGSQYLSDHFIKQVKFWGIKPSFAFVEQPQTNGVAERFNRTLKEQAIYGSIFRNIEEVRRAVGKFVQDYNAEWRVEKNGFRSPRQAREAWFAALSKQAA